MTAPLASAELAQPRRPWQLEKVQFGAMANQPELEVHAGMLISDSVRSGQPTQSVNSRKTVQLGNLVLRYAQRLRLRGSRTDKTSWVRISGNQGRSIDYCWATERASRVSAILLPAEEKSRQVDLAKGESFGFLGFEFRCIRSLQGKWRPYYPPKLKQRTALLRKLKDIFRRFDSQPVGRVVQLINPILRGWVNYFAIGNASRYIESLGFRNCGEPSLIVERGGWPPGTCYKSRRCGS